MDRLAAIDQRQGLARPRRRLRSRPTFRTSRVPRIGDELTASGHTDASDDRASLPALRRGRHRHAAWWMSVKVVVNVFISVSCAAGAPWERETL